jgi:hypothetical protein
MYKILKIMNNEHKVVKMFNEFMLIKFGQVCYFTTTTDFLFLLFDHLWQAGTIPVEEKVRKFSYENAKNIIGKKIVCNFCFKTI